MRLIMRTGWLAHIIVALGAVGAPRTISAQSDLARLCRANSIPVVGQWASFDVVFKGATGANHTRLATVAAERHEDSTLYWLEVRYTGKTDSAPKAILQILIPGLPAEPTSVRALRLKTGNLPAMQVADQTLGAITRQIRQEYPALGTVSSCLSAEVVGWETVEVPAGSFRALHVRDSNCEEWLADSIPFGMVKLQSADGETVLTAHGEDAKSSITETPQQFPQWMSELATSLGSKGGVGSRDSSQQARAAKGVCDSLVHSNLIQSDSEPSLPPAGLLFLWASGDLPGIEERPHLLMFEGRRPKYPKQARRHGIEGRVIIQAILDTKGRPEPGSVRIVSTPDSTLGLAAQYFVEGAHFAPGRLCGLPVRVKVELPVDYKITPR